MLCEGIDDDCQFIPVRRSLQVQTSQFCNALQFADALSDELIVCP